MTGVPTVAGEESPYEDALRVRPAERDRALEVNASAWPVSAPEGWDLADHCLRRTIPAEGPRSPIPAPIEELILRFPSAPVHGLQRLHEHHRELGPSENFHTYRILRSSLPEVVDRPIRRIFLMHTGLNERDRMGLYYRLASQLIAQGPETVCIVRPFPGHMTRYPFQAFAETPLDLYLWDGSHLFRQFLRFMIETQWLLSAIVRRSSYRCASGAETEIDMRRGIEGFLDFAYSRCGSSAAILKPIREDQVRVVNVSRARYNPRFRGRLLVDAGAARKRILHAALCLALSEPIFGQDASSIFV